MKEYVFFLLAVAAVYFGSSLLWRTVLWVAVYIRRKAGYDVD